MAKWLGNAKAWFSWNCQLEPPTCAFLDFLTAGQLITKGVFKGSVSRRTKEKSLMTYLEKPYNIISTIFMGQSGPQDYGGSGREH